MRHPPSQAGLGTLMVAIAAMAAAMGAARVLPGLGPIVLELAIAYPILTRATEAGGRRPRPDLGRAARAYLGGVVLPTICLIFDPFVFRGMGPNGQGFLGPPRVGFYTFMIGEMVLLTVYLATGAAGRGAGLLAGAFGIGAVYAAVLGVCMVPISIFGTFYFGIGLLGFSPLWAAWVYGAAARESARAMAGMSDVRRVFLPLAGGAGLVTLAVVVNAFGASVG